MGTERVLTHTVKREMNSSRFSEQTCRSHLSRSNAKDIVMEGESNSFSLRKRRCS